MNAANPTVFLVDDEPGVRKAVERLLRSAGYAVSAFASADEFIAVYDAASPGCLILDLSMPKVDGLALQRRLQAAGMELPIVFLTGHGDVTTSVKAMKAGAVDFLTKPAKARDLLKAVSTAIDRDHNFRQKQTALARTRERLATLTQREREVLSFVIGGKLNKQIAADLGTVEKTIKVHRARMMQKMGVQSVAKLVRLAEALGIDSRS